MKIVRLPFAVFFVLLLLEVRRVLGSHTEFEFKADGIEVVVGAGPSQIDEFDDGNLAPWISFRGTAFESGGFLVLRDPGVDALLPGHGVTVDVSDVYRFFSGMLLEEDFEVTSTWAPIIPDPPGERFATSVHYTVGSGPAVQAFGLVLQNLGDAEAAPFGLPSGLRIVQVLVDAVPNQNAPGYQSISFPSLASVAVSPGDVTGDILFRIHWLAPMRQFTTSFSLDRGMSFQSPFAPVQPANLASGAATVGMVGDPVLPVSAVPALGAPGQGALLLLLALLALVSSRRARCSGARRAWPPAARYSGLDDVRGVRLVVGARLAVVREGPVPALDGGANSLRR